MLIKAALSCASPAGPDGKLSILIFHRVLPHPDPLMPSEPDVNRFDQIIRWITDWFNVLPLGEAVEQLKRHQLPARAAAITFDDGYADNLLHATPILRKHGVRATFFIATGYIDGGLMWNDALTESIRAARQSHIDLGFLGLGSVSLSSTEEKRLVLEQAITAIKPRPHEDILSAVSRIQDICGEAMPDNLMLTTPQLKELVANGMELGAHTVNHPNLTNLLDPEVSREIIDSRDFLSSLAGQPIQTFAYPNGRLGRDYLPRHAQIVRELGFSAAVTTNWGVSSSTSDLFQLPRFTPWDRLKPMFGLRLLSNCQPPKQLD